MMGKKLEWDKQQNLDDKNQIILHNIKFEQNKYILQQRFIIFGMLQKKKLVSIKNHIRPKFETNRCYFAPESD